MAREYLAQYRKRTGLRSGDMAERIGIPEGDYNQLEHGRLRVRTDVELMAKISAALGQPVQCILQHEIDLEKAGCF